MSQAHKLRLFDEQAAETAADSSGFDVSPHMRLTEFYRNFLLPNNLLDASPAYLKDLRTTLKYWALATADPPLVEITDFTISRFRKWLGNYEHRGHPLAPLTRRKHLVNLQNMLDRAGPPTKSRDVPTAKLISETFAIPKPVSDDDELNDCFTLEEMASYWSACQFVRLPEGLVGVTPCAFWRCAGMLAYNTALRVKTLLALRWDWLIKDEFGHWFDIPAAAMKRKRRFKCFVNAHAMRAITRLRGSHPTRVLPWTLGEGWFHKCRRHLLELSCLPEDRRLGFHGFRKACATELGIINAYAAPLQLGHKTRNVTIENYTHRRALVEAHTRLPQPPWQGDFDGRQGLLFG